MHRNSNQREQERIELAAFDAFADLAKLVVLTRKKMPDTERHPDIHCRLADGSEVAYELVQLGEQRCLAKDGRHDRRVRCLFEAIDENGSDHLNPWYIRVKFRECVSDRKVKAMAPQIVDVLNSLPPDFEGDVPDERLNCLLNSVLHINITKWGGTKPFVDIGLITSWTDPEPGRESPSDASWDQLLLNYQEKLEEKFEIQYVSRAPIELIGWCAHWGWGFSSEMWLPQLSEGITSRTNLGPFRRIWIAELFFENRLLFCHPT